MKNQRLAFLLSTAIAVTLSACAYRDIHPEAEERDQALEEAVDSVTPGSAKLIFRSRGAGHAVNYSLSTTSAACPGFQSVGNVAYSGRGVVYPWIARMTERTRGAIAKTQPSIEQEVKPGESIQVRGLGRWDQNTGVSMRTGTCGPVISKFVPKDGHTYLVEFVWQENLTCTQTILDATNPAELLPTQVEPVPACPAS